MREETLERFHASYSKNEAGCWIWHRVFNDRGYGYFKGEGRRQGAHRWAYELFVGPIPEGFEMHHVCEVPACVNPDHLRALSKADHGKTRRKTHCKRGHALTDDNVYLSRTKRGYLSRACRACGIAQSRAKTLRTPKKARVPKPIQHGTVNGYNNRGCRCVDCRKAWSAYMNERNHRTGRRKPYAQYVAEKRAAALARDNHGTETRYKLGCRCVTCRAAVRDARARRRATQRLAA